MSLKYAISQALQNPISPIGRNSISRFAAVLTDGNKTYVGWNTYKTHPLQKKFGMNEESVHLHAELAAINGIIRWKAKLCGKNYDSVTDLSDYKMTIARVLKDGTPAMAMPCEGCQRAIIHYGIRDVKWTI